MPAAQHRILYVFRTQRPREGTVRTVAAFPCDPNVAPYLPPDSQILRKLARAACAALPKGDGRRTVEHAELCSSPGPGGPTTADPASVRTALFAAGIERTGTGRDEREGDTYDCTLSDILAAIGDVRAGGRPDTPARRRKAAKRHKKAKGGHPAADALDWNEAVATVEALERDERWRDALLVASGCFLGLRISDILLLRWRHLTETDVFTLEETKTGKKRSLKINPRLKALASTAMRELDVEEPDRLVFESWVKGEGHPITRQRAAQILKEIKATYGIKSAGVFSTHSLRKTFGRRVWLQECRKGRGEHALLLLCDVFGHSSIAITKCYLGIRQDEILSVYDNL